jgi:hypothetical protein
VTDLYVYVTDDYEQPIKTTELSDQVLVDKRYQKIIGVEVLNIHRLEVDGKDIIAQRDRLLDALERVAADRCVVDDMMGSPCKERGREFRMCGVCIARDILAKGI